MPEYTQKTIESFFDQYDVTDPDLKAKILSDITSIIYDYNMHVVSLEKETDEYKKRQILNDLNEISDKIRETFGEAIKKHGKRVD
ncbi:hypothetical protein JW899_03335 [Candidatus Uhrbacteria bacterium]|nr:hypothetical protein [Candidatus Uhrbacteria bacterium]